MIAFHQCAVVVSDAFGAPRHARLRRVFFKHAWPGDRGSTEALLALHRRLKRNKRDGVVVFEGSVMQWDGMFASDNDSESKPMSDSGKLWAACL